MISDPVANITRISSTNQCSYKGLRSSWEVMLVSREATVSELASIRILNVGSTSGILIFVLSRT